MLLIISLAGCREGRPIAGEVAQAKIEQAWRASQHTIWEIEWSNMPLGGPVTVAVWRHGPQYRFEILEAPAPALTGETLVMDGRQAWQYNRLQRPLTVTSTSPHLAPVTEAFSLIEGLLMKQPQSARQQSVTLLAGANEKISLMYQSGDRLTVWLSRETGLVVQIRWGVAEQAGQLTARFQEPLPEPAQRLFKPGP